MHRFLRSNGSVILALVGMSFLWPYFQRAFFRVTLFHRLGDFSEPFYGLFLVLFLAGTLVLVVFHRRIGDRLILNRAVVLTASVTSVVAAIYLSGLVAPAAEGLLSMLLTYLAIVGYACSLLVVSATWMVLLVRIVYTKGLFHAVSVMAASSMIGFLLAPTFVSSSLSMGFMPICGILIAGMCAWAGCGVIDEDTGSSQYQSLSQAPYIKTWIAPLVAYGLFAVSHAIGFAGESSREVHVTDGQLMAATSSFADYVVFFVFSAIILAAAVRSWEGSKHYQEKATFWVASMGVSIGLFFGLFFANALADPPFSAFSVMSAISPCFPILLAFISLLMTYQNRLAPLQSFGLLFFAMCAIEKVLSYIVLPPIVSLMAVLTPEIARMIDVAISAVSLIALLVFLVKFCQTDTLRMLFSTAGTRSYSSELLHEATSSHTVCLGLAQEHNLTNRELEILNYLALGYSAKRTGEMLFISERTVQTHTRNIYRKLDIHTRQDVIDLVGMS